MSPNIFNNSKIKNFSFLYLYSFYINNLLIFINHLIKKNN